MSILKGVRKLSWYSEPGILQIMVYKVIPSSLGGMEQQTCTYCVHESQRQGMLLKDESINQILIVVRQLEQMSDAEKLLQSESEGQ